MLVPIVLPELKRPARAESVSGDSRSTIPNGETPPNSTLTLAPHPIGELQQQTWTWFWYGLPAMVFSAILALTLGYALLARRRREEQQTPDRSASPSAYLVPVADEQIRHKLDRTPWRIGRSRSSELTLNDTSVSRLHAEIRRDALGQFTVQDLESLNGVFVNGEPVEMAHLEENDRVEIGDVAFLFTLHDDDDDDEYEQQEPTAFIHTLSPR